MAVLLLFSLAAASSSTTDGRTGSSRPSTMMGMWRTVGPFEACWRLFGPGEDALWAVASAVDDGLPGVWCTVVVNNDRRGLAAPATSSGGTDTGGAELALKNPLLGGESAAPGLDPAGGKSPVALRAAGLCIRGRLGDSPLWVGKLDWVDPCNKTNTHKVLVIYGPRWPGGKYKTKGNQRNLEFTPIKLDQ